jgi:hypothetical protein
MALLPGLPRASTDEAVSQGVMAGNGGVDAYLSMPRMCERSSMTVVSREVVSLEMSSRE